MNARWFKGPRALRLYIGAYGNAYIEWRPQLERWDVFASRDGFPMRALRTDDLFTAVGMVIALNRGHGRTVSIEQRPAAPALPPSLNA